jgi:hypothetical protein
VSQIRLIAGILVQFAEWELQSIGERRPCRAPEPVTVASVRDNPLARQGRQ